MWLEEVGQAKFVLAAEFTRRANGQVAASARQFGVFVSMKTGRPVPLPEEYNVSSEQ